MTGSAQRHPRLFVVQVLSPAFLVMDVGCHNAADFAIRFAKKECPALVRIDSKLRFVLLAYAVKRLSSF